jgi:hypothetical protein
LKNKTILAVILISIAVAILAGFFASSHPDGLEKVAGGLKFEEKVKDTPGVFIDYQLPMLSYPALSTALAGITGLIIIFFIFKSIARMKYLGEFLKKLLNIR